MKASKKIAASIAAGGIAVASAGVAYAYWSTSGEGTGTASTSAGDANLQVDQVSAPSDMAPGVDPGDISVKVTNLADNKAAVSQVVVSIDSIDSTGSCSADDYTLSGATMTDGATELDAAGGDNDNTTFTGATLGFNDKSDTNQDGCKGATVHLKYTVS